MPGRAWAVSRGSTATYLDGLIEYRGSVAEMTARIGADGAVEWLTVRLHLQRPPRWGLAVAEWVARWLMWLVGR